MVTTQSAALTTDVRAPVLVMYAWMYVMSVFGVAILDITSLAVVVFVGAWGGTVAWRVVCFGGVTAVDVVFVVFLASFQNVILGVATPYLSAHEVKVLLSLNFLLPALWLVVVWCTRPQILFRSDFTIINGILLGLAAVTIVWIGWFGFNGVATISSIRNLTAPVVFVTLGVVVASHRVQLRTTYVAIAYVGIAVIALGVIERFVFPDVWLGLNVSELWEKKGLTNIAQGGVPWNWYSAERFRGDVLRRMVSTYADPVNLGTFLNLVLLAGVALRRRWVIVAATAAIVLTVSKGGAVGLLILCVVYSYYRLPRAVFGGVVVTAVGLGTGFVMYSLENATGSLIRHFFGAVNALAGLVEQPLGRGVGFVGTLAQQFADLGRQDILESGIGVIVGQLGFAGLALYGILFHQLLARIRRLRDRTTVVVGISMLFSITFNIVFNEVALSPNSSALYFFVLGQLMWLGSRSSMARPKDSQPIAAT